MYYWTVEPSADFWVNLPNLSDDEKEFLDLVEQTYSSSNVSLEEAFEKTEMELSLYLEPEQKEYLLYSAKILLEGYGCFEPLLNNDNIEEIAVINPNLPIYVYVVNKGWERTNIKVGSVDALIFFVNKMAAHIGRRITWDNPRINGVMSNGYRFHATLPPISTGELTIRRFRSNPFSPSDLSESIFNPDFLAKLSLLFQADFSILIAGNTASGKTTTLNALSSFLPLNERVLLIEESPEINLLHPHKVSLVSSPQYNIGLQDLVEDSLRMRPDRVILGEIRTREEASAFFDSLLSGQSRGCYATFHAESVSEAYRRFVNYGISEIDLPSLDLVLILRRTLEYDQKNRKNYEVRKFIEFGDHTKSYGVKFPPKLLNRVASELSLSKSELEEEIKLRKEFIKSYRGMDFQSFFSGFQKEFYSLGS